MFQGWLNTVSLSGNSSRKSPSTTATTKKDQNDAITKEHLRKRALILALLKREIEKFSAWRNPNRVASSSLPGEDSIAALSSQITMTEKSWRECTRVAWKLSPRLCINLAVRSVHPKLLLSKLLRGYNPMAGSLNP